MEIGDKVSFTLEKQTLTGTISKAYENSYLISFKSDDAEIVDKYHDRVVINKKKVKASK